MIVAIAVLVPLTFLRKVPLALLAKSKKAVFAYIEVI
jgi:hypothetical protein